MRARRHLTRKLRNRMKSIVSVLLASSMVLNPLSGISSAAGSERASSRIDISGLIEKKVNISLDSDDLKSAALAAISEGNVYDVGNYLSTDAATDTAFENLMKEDKPFYELRIWSDEEENQMEDNGVDVKILVQRDTEETKVPETLATRSQMKSSDVSFRYDAHDAASGHEMAFYQPGGVLGDLLIDFQADRLYHESTVKEDAADSSYELTGDETITILYMNTDKTAHTFKLSVDGKTFSTGIKTVGTESLAKQILQKLKKTMKEDLCGTTETEETLAAESTGAVTAAASNAEAIDTATASEIPATEVSEETIAAEAPSTEASEETVAAETPTTEVLTTEESSSNNEETTTIAEETAVTELTATEETTVAELTTAAEETIAAENRETDAGIASPSEIPIEESTEETEQTTTAETKVITDMDESLADERKETLRTVTAKDIAAEITSAKLVQYSLSDITGDFKSADLGAYLVKVYPVTENAIGADWRLEVKELLRDDQEAKADNADENSAQMSEATKQALTDAGIYDNSRSLDIKLVDADGNEVEPKGTVRVEIEVAKELLDEENATSFSVYHVEENTDGSINKVKAMDSSTTAIDTVGEVIDDSNAIVTEAMENTEAIAAVSEMEEENSTETAAVETVKKLSDTVASMKTVFTVDSFSTFTITWENSSGALTIITEDEDGNQLQAYGQSGIQLQEGQTYYFNEDDSHFFVPYHAVEAAYYVKDGVNTNVASAKMASDEIVLSDSKGQEVARAANLTVHLQYRYDVGDNVMATSTFSANDAPTHNKTLRSNDDGTYTLALDVTGKSSASTDTTKANVIIVFDKSGSMGHEDHKYDKEYGWIATYEKVENPSKNSKDYYGVDDDGEYQKLTYYWGDGWYIGSNRSDLRRYNKQEFYRITYVSRLSIAKQATNALVDTLVSSGQIANLSLVQFSSGASEKTYSASDYTEFKTAVNAITAEGGTNWEAALKLALEKVDTFKSADSKQPNYVIFVSDGMPTMRINGGNGSDYTEENYTAALKQSKKIVGDGAEFYTISAFGDLKDASTGTNKMEDLTKDSYLGDEERYKGHYYSAGDSDNLNKAFSDIAKKITHAQSYRSIRIADTLTKDTAIAADPDFTYEIKTKVTNDGTYTYTTYTFKIDAEGKIQDLKEKKADGTEVDVTEIPTFTDSNTGKSYSDFRDGSEFPAASYETSTKSVIWDLGDDFVLPDGWTFTVKFQVWPDQTAYDNAAAWKNNENSADSTKKFNSTTYGTDTQGYVERTEGGEKKYYLYSNTAAQLDYKAVSYTDGTETGSSDLQNASYSKPDPMPLNVARLAIKKVWSGGDENHREEVTVNIGDEEIKLNSDNQWTAVRYLAPGLEVTDQADPSKKTTRNVGHDYTISETAVKGYITSYKLDGTEVSGSTVTVKPMLVDSASSIQDVKNSYAAWTGDAELTVTNTYNPPIPTGIYMDVRPYITAVVIALAGAALLLLENEERKRMRR